MLRLAPLPVVDEVDFVREAAHAIAALTPDDRAPDCLTLPLVVSASMRRGRVDLDQACVGMLALRDGLLATSGVDKSVEPVPLVVGDRRRALLSLAAYLDGLVGRAARAASIGRREVVDRALILIAS